jgi:hypothetical protein
MQLIDAAIGECLKAEKPKIRDVIRLCMWIRFSGSYELHRQACVDTAAAFIENKSGSAQTRLFADPDLRYLYEDILITHDLTRWHKDYNGATPCFDLTSHETSPGFHELSEIADAVHFLLWYKPKTNDKRKRASLNRAYHFMAVEGFRGKSINSWRSFLNLWQKHQHAAGLIYAADYLVDESWIIDPMQSGFVSHVKALTDKAAVIRLLSHAKAVEQALSTILHPKTQRRIKPAAIPASIPAAVLEPVTLREAVYEAFDDYEPGASP